MELEELERFENIGAALVRLQALSGVMRRTFSVLIASHPEPKRLRDEWQARREQWIEQEATDAMYWVVPEYREMFLDLLNQLAAEIDAASARHRRTASDPKSPAP